MPEVSYECVPEHCRRFLKSAMVLSDLQEATVIQEARLSQIGRSTLFSLLFHAGQAAIRLPSTEASKRAQCTSPGHTPYTKGIMKTP